MSYDTNRATDSGEFPSINYDVMRLWIEALRSDEYEQGNGALERTRDYFVRYENGDENYPVYEVKTKQCCLGVLCRVAIKNGLDLKTEMKHSDVAFGAQGNVSYLPWEVADWAGFKVSHEVDGAGTTQWEYMSNLYVSGFSKTNEGERMYGENGGKPIRRMVSQWNDTHGWDFKDIADALEREFFTSDGQPKFVKMNEDDDHDHPMFHEDED